MTWRDLLCAPLCWLGFHRRPLVDHVISGVGVLHRCGRCLRLVRVTVYQT